MGFLSRTSTVTPGLRRGARYGDPFASMYGAFVPPGWYGAVSAAGVPVTPELAMTLSSLYCGVAMIADDIGTMPAHQFRRLENGGRQHVPKHRGLEYRLKFQPNVLQTAKEFWTTLIGHFILRGWFIAEIVSSPTSAIDQLVPRHPDRIKPERLPSGRVRYRKLMEFAADGGPKYLTQNEVFTCRDFSSDGVTPQSRIAFGMTSFGSALAQEKFAAQFFKGGATASMALIHKGGELDPDDESRLHTSIARYMAGVENAAGFVVLEDDISIEKLGIEPEKAQLLGSREFTIREVARWLKMPAHKLQAAMQTESYASVEVKELAYIITTLRPIVVGIEQAIQRDLILADDKEEFYIKFAMEALLRGDMKARADYYRTAIQFGWMNRNEVRLLEELNPVVGLDRFLEPENMRDSDEGSRGRRGRDRDARHVGRGRTPAAENYRAVVLAHEAALRVVRKEIAAIGKLAQKHADDAEGWQAELRAFYDDHAAFVSQTLRLPLSTSRAYAAKHGLALAEQGIGVMSDWEISEVADLAMTALDPDERAA